MSSGTNRWRTDFATYGADGGPNSGGISSAGPAESGRTTSGNGLAINSPCGVISADSLKTSGPVSTPKRNGFQCPWS